MIINPKKWENYYWMILDNFWIVLIPESDVAVIEGIVHNKYRIIFSHTLIQVFNPTQVDEFVKHDNLCECEGILKNIDTSLNSNASMFGQKNHLLTKNGNTIIEVRAFGSSNNLIEVGDGQEYFSKP